MYQRHKVATIKKSHKLEIKVIFFPVLFHCFACVCWESAHFFNYSSILTNRCSCVFFLRKEKAHFSTESVTYLIYQETGNHEMVREKNQSRDETGK